MQDNEPINLTYGQMSDMVNRIEQIPSLSGEGAPTIDTPAFHLGQTYIDTITGDMYYCSDIFDESGGLPQYTWNLAAEDVPEYVAGDNVTIEDESGALVISATDTTYSNFVGTDGTAAGTAGLVPAPATTDVGKFLKADGTWDSAGGGSGDITELTSADYDYPDDSPDGVALWRLDGGLYYVSDGTTKLYTNNITSSTPVAQTTLLLIRNPAPNAQAISIIRQTNGTDVPHAYVTNINNGNGIVLNKSLGGPTVNDTLTSTSTSQALSANQGKVLKDLVDSIAIRATGAPTTSTVGSVGTLYEDTANGKLYQCTDTTGGSYTWVEVGAGGGPTVVQTTGTSTTDVMSQNAVTSMVFADPANKTKIAIGEAANSRSAYTICVGAHARADNFYGIAIGGGANDGSTLASPNYSIAIGGNAKVTTGKQGSIALGYGSSVSAAGEMNIGTYDSSAGYNSSNYRLLTGLYDGQSAHDAATYGQVISYSAINGAGAPTTTTEGKYVGQLYYDTTNEAMYFLKTIDTTTTPATYTWEALGGGGSGPTVVQTMGDSTTDVMSQNAATSMIYSDPQYQQIIKIGTYQAYNPGTRAVAIGFQANGMGNYSTCVGGSAKSGGQYSLALGNGAKTDQNYSVVLGSLSTTSATGEVSIGGSSLGTHGYNNSSYRLLTNVYDPQSAHDAATKGYVDPSTDSSAPTTATVGRLGQIQIDTANNDAYMCVAVDDVTPAYTWKKITA